MHAGISDMFLLNMVFAPDFFFKCQVLVKLNLIFKAIFFCFFLIRCGPTEENQGGKAL